MDAIAVAKFLSIPTAYLLSGYSIAASQSSVPLVYNQPASVSTNVLKGVFNRGAAIVAPGAILSATAFAYLAYVRPMQRRLYATAGALTLVPLLFTRAVMYGGIQRLIEISESASQQAQADQNGEAVKLLKAWVAQNWVRAALSFTAGSIGLSTSWNEV